MGNSWVILTVMLGFSFISAMKVHHLIDERNGKKAKSTDTIGRCSGFLKFVLRCSLSTGPSCEAFCWVFSSLPVCFCPPGSQNNFLFFFFLPYFERVIVRFSVFYISYMRVDKCYCNTQTLKQIICMERTQPLIVNIYNLPAKSL